MEIPSSEWTILDSVDSTQTYVRDLIAAGQNPSVVFAYNQTAGRGRFNRTWLSKPESSLTMSIAFPDYADIRQPWILGMSIATVVASVIHCQIQWPNDLVIRNKKVGGILTELVLGQTGDKIPVVGIGINLNLTEFPKEILDRATSLRIATGRTFNSLTVARTIVEALGSAPEPTDWHGLAPIWSLYDSTPGKEYKLASGEIGTAIGIGPSGELICSVNGETQSVMAAEAIFGPDLK